MQSGKVLTSWHVQGACTCLCVGTQMQTCPCRQEFTLEEEDEQGVDTDMERGQLLLLSALSSDSLPAVTRSDDNIALQPVSRLQEVEHQGSRDHVEVMK